MNYLNLCNAVERFMYESILTPLETINPEEHEAREALGILDSDIRKAADAIIKLFEGYAFSASLTDLQRYLIDRELSEIDYIQLAEIFALRCEYPFEDWEETEQALRDIIMLRKGAKVNFRNELKK